jgi:hypothetical protein
MIALLLMQVIMLLLKRFKQKRGTFVEFKLMKNSIRKLKIE